MRNFISVFFLALQNITLTVGACDLSRAELRELYLNTLPIWGIFNPSSERLIISADGNTMIVVQDDEFVVRDRMSGGEERMKMPFGIDPSVSDRGEFLNLVEERVFEWNPGPNTRPRRRVTDFTTAKSHVVGFALSASGSVSAVLTKNMNISWRQLDQNGRYVGRIQSLGWQAPKGKRFNLEKIFQMQSTPDLSRIVIAQGNRVLMQQISGGASLLEHESQISDVRISVDGKVLWILTSYSLEKWIWTKGSWIKRDASPVPLSLKPHSSLVLSREGNQLFVESQSGEWLAYKDVSTPTLTGGVQERLMIDGVLHLTLASPGNVGGGAVLRDVTTTRDGIILGLDRQGAVHRLKVDSLK